MSAGTRRIGVERGRADVLAGSAAGGHGGQLEQPPGRHPDRPVPSHLLQELLPLVH